MGWLGVDQFRTGRQHNPTSDRDALLGERAEPTSTGHFRAALLDENEGTSGPNPRHEWRTGGRVDVAEDAASNEEQHGIVVRPAELRHGAERSGRRIRGLLIGW